MLKDIQDKLIKLRNKIKDLGAILNIETKRKKARELEEISSRPDLWQDRQKAQTVLSELKELERQISLWEGLRSKSDDL